MTTVIVDDLNVEKTLTYPGDPDIFRILTKNKKDDGVEFSGILSIRIFPYTKKFSKVQVTITDQKIRSLPEHDAATIRILMELIEIHQDGVNVGFLFDMMGSSVNRKNTFASNLGEAKLSIPIKSMSNYTNLDLGNNYFVTLQFKE